MTDLTVISGRSRAHWRDDRTSTLYFTRYPGGANGLETHEAFDERGYCYSAHKKGLGWFGAVLDPNGAKVREIDWSDHRVQINEMRNYLQRIATGEQP